MRMTCIVAGASVPIRECGHHLNARIAYRIASNAQAPLAVTCAKSSETLTTAVHARQDSPKRMEIVLTTLFVAQAGIERLTEHATDATQAARPAPEELLRIA